MEKESGVVSISLRGGKKKRDEVTARELKKRKYRNPAQKRDRGKFSPYLSSSWRRKGRKRGRREKRMQIL